MKITGKTVFHPDSEVNGKKIKDMSTEEREEFIKRWKERHGGDVQIMADYE